MVIRFVIAVVFVLTGWPSVARIQDCVTENIFVRSLVPGEQTHVWTFEGRMAQVMIQGYNVMFPPHDLVADTVMVMSYPPTKTIRLFFFQRACLIDHLAILSGDQYQWLFNRKLIKEVLEIEGLELKDVGR